MMVAWAVVGSTTTKRSAGELSTMYETILVGTDGSKAAEAALAHAIDIAESLGAAVHVLTVVDTNESPFRFGVEEVDAIDRASTELIDDIVAAHEDSDVTIRGEVRRGRPEQTIVEYADSIGADVIVVGQQGEADLEDRLLGSTTDRIARLTNVPLIVVPNVTDF